MPQDRPPTEPTESDAPVGGSRSGGRIFVILSALAAGAGSMVIELASVRALAPWFGASTEVWTGAIGVVLLALAAGYAAGGAIAERGHSVQSLAIALATAGALSALAPWLLPIVAHWVIPSNLSLSDALWILRAGGLFAQSAIFGVPVFLLGFANPLLVRAHPDSARFPGKASGQILAWSTLGGLLGTFGTTYTLIPTFGVRATLYGCGLALGTLGIVLFVLGRGRKRNVAAALLSVGTAAFVAYPSLTGPIKSAGSEATLIAERESREQYLRVIEPVVPNRAKNPALERWLQANECLDSFQSLDAPRRATPGHYYDVLAAAALFSGEARDANICIVGAGAGSVVRSISQMFDAPRVDAIELDPAAVDLGRAHLRLGELESIATFYTGVDGRVALRHLGGKAAGAAVPPRGGYDAILIDAYARQVEIPFHLVTKEMFELCHSKLADGGVMAINISSFGSGDPVLRAVAATALSVFDPGNGASKNLCILNVRGDHNAVVVVRKRLSVPTPARFLAWSRNQKKPAATSCAQTFAGPGGVVPFEVQRGDLVLTDDLAPMETLQSLSLERAGKAQPGG